MSQPVIPLLKILPVHTLQPHERLDSGRSESLISKFEQAEVLINPPIVLDLEETAKKFVVLDGANRVQAFHTLGFPDILVQQARQNVEVLRVENWNHLVVGISKLDMLDYLTQWSGLNLRAKTRERALENLETKRTVAFIEFDDHEVLEFPADCATIGGVIEPMSKISLGYMGQGLIERTHSNRLDPSLGIQKDHFLVVYPRFTVHEVMHAASQSILFPSGITRFIVSPRALHLNYPLDSLTKPLPLEEKQWELERWLKARFDGGKVRYYEESTYSFDE